MDTIKRREVDRRRRGLRFDIVLSRPSCLALRDFRKSPGADGGVPPPPPLPSPERRCRRRRRCCRRRRRRRRASWQCISCGGCWIDSRVSPCVAREPAATAGFARDATRRARERERGGSCVRNRSGRRRPYCARRFVKNGLPCDNFFSCFFSCMTIVYKIIHFFGN